MKFLLIGDETRMRRLLSFGVAIRDDEAACLHSAESLTRLRELSAYEVALIDWDMRSADAASLVRHIARLAPDLPTVALVARAARSEELLAAGICGTLTKPVEIDALRAALARHAAATRSLRQPAEAARPSTEILPRNEPFKRQLAVAARVAASGVNTLLLGENGTGKTRLARALHDWSPRRDRPFVTVKCPCLQPQLLESELFGHVRGAFTGAVADTRGLVGTAEGGTLFLDEVGELPLALQPKLLRLVEERRYERIGEPRSRHAAMAG